MSEGDEKNEKKSHQQEKKSKLFQSVINIHATVNGSLAVEFAVYSSYKITVVWEGCRRGEVAEKHPIFHPICDSGNFQSRLYLAFLWCFLVTFFALHFV